MTTFVALLRAINVGGRKVPMAELRALCDRLGLSDVRTYIQSGNLVFRSTDPPDRLETLLEEGIEDEFGFEVPVIVRTADEWSGYLPLNPFGEASAETPNLVMLALSKSRPKPDAAAALTSRAESGERVEATGDALWIHFPNGSARSKLTPALLDRLVGSPVTTRNWRTVQKLAELATSDS